MRVLEYCHASAIEAVNRANDPALPEEARVEWARIARVWKDIGQHYDRIEDIPPKDRLLEAAPTTSDTLH